MVGLVEEASEEAGWKDGGTYNPVGFFQEFVHGLVRVAMAAGVVLFKEGGEEGC